MAGPQRNVTDDGKNLSALVNGNRASIIQPNFHPPGAFLLHKAADVRIGLQDELSIFQLFNFRRYDHPFSPCQHERA